MMRNGVHVFWFVDERCCIRRNNTLHQLISIQFAYELSHYYYYYNYYYIAHKTLTHSQQNTDSKHYVSPTNTHTNKRKYYLK